MLSSFKKLAISGFLALYYSLCPVYAEENLETRPINNFVKYKKDKALETSVIFYKSKDKPVVCLASTVHSGDRGYYSDLQIISDGLDIILYECIKSENKKNPFEILDIPRYINNISIDAICFMSEDMDLSTQHIMMKQEDKRWVCCDFTKEELLKKRFEKTFGLSFFKDVQNIAFNEFYIPFLYVSKEIEYDLLSKKERAIGLRKLFIEKLDEESRKDPTNEKDENNCLVKERNGMALFGLDYFLKKRPNLRSICLLYGGGHAPHLDLEIRKRGYKPAATLWLEAWKVKNFDFRNQGTPYLDYEVKEILKELSL